MRSRYNLYGWYFPDVLRNRREAFVFCLASGRRIGIARINLLNLRDASHSSSPPTWMKGATDLRNPTVFRVPNGRRKTGLDQLVRSKVKSSPMVEIRPAGQSGLWKPTWPRLVWPGLPSNWICYFITIYYVQVKLFLIKLIVFHELYGGDSVSLRLGVAKIGSWVFNHFWFTKWVILHAHMPQYRYWMRLIDQVIIFPPHIILSRILYQLLLRSCWFIAWQATLRS